MDYQKAGVNVKAGDSASDAFYKASKTTWQYRKGSVRVQSAFDEVSAWRVIDVSHLKDTV